MHWQTFISRVRDTKQGLLQREEAHASLEFCYSLIVMPAVAEKHIEYYPDSDNMGQHPLQSLNMEFLRPLIQQWLAELKRVAFVGSDQFFYFERHNMSARIAPDVYVIDNVPQDHPLAGSWKLWEGHFPSFAFEICGDDIDKDYVELPKLYGEIGTRELIVFDPHASKASRRRVQWQVFRREDNNGQSVFRLVQQSKGPTIESRELGCYFTLTTSRGYKLVRLALDSLGNQLVMTAEERALMLAQKERVVLSETLLALENERQAKEQERQAKEQERQAKEQERQAKEYERQEKEKALAELVELRKLLAEMKKPE